MSTRANCETMWCSMAARENRVDGTAGAGFKPAHTTAAPQNSPNSPICVVLQLVQLCLRILAPGEQIGDIDPAVFRFEVGVFGPFVDVEAVALVYGRIARALFFVDKRFLSGYVVLGIVHARLSTRNQDIINPPGI